MTERLTKGLIKGGDGRARCVWPGDLSDYLAYHDDEWGLPVANDHRLFEKICLEKTNFSFAYIEKFIRFF